MEKKWIFKELPDEAKVAALAEQISEAEQIEIEKPLAAILIQRGVDTPEKAHDFFNPDISKIHNPFLMKDMDKAVNRLSQAIMNNERILVYGDYDVDGTSAVALLYSFICEIIGADSKNLVEYYIPDRYAEGYGISDQGIEYCHNNNINLLISLDCGIKANEKVQKANEYGIDVIICDHHLEGDELPKAVAILDPKRKDCPYPYKELSEVVSHFPDLWIPSRACGLVEGEHGEVAGIEHVSYRISIMEYQGSFVAPVIVVASFSSERAL